MKFSIVASATVTEPLWTVTELLWEDILRSCLSQHCCSLWLPLVAVPMTGLRKAANINLESNCVALASLSACSAVTCGRCLSVMASVRKVPLLPRTDSYAF